MEDACRPLARAATRAARSAGRRPPSARRSPVIALARRAPLFSFPAGRGLTAPTSIEQESPPSTPPRSNARAATLVLRVLIPPNLPIYLSLSRARARARARSRSDRADSRRARVLDPRRHRRDPAPSRPSASHDRARRLRPPLGPPRRSIARALSMSLPLSLSIFSKSDLADQ